MYVYLTCLILNVHKFFFNFPFVYDFCFNTDNNNKPSNITLQLLLTEFLTANK